MIVNATTLDQRQTNSFNNASETPTLLKGWCADWAACEKWNNKYLVEHYGDATVPISSYKEKSYQPTEDRLNVRLADYLTSVEGDGTHDELNSDSYLAGWHFMRNAPEVMDDITIPMVFQDNLIDNINNSVINYDQISMFIGHSDVESPLHTDSFFVSVWLAVVKGRKTIRLVAPTDYEHIYNGLDVFDDDNVQKLDDLGLDVYEAEIGEGDIMFIPSGYWHQVRNHGFNIAISTNYLAPHNFLVFEQQLKAKLLKPYFNLLEIKRALLANPENSTMTKAASLAHANFAHNEAAFIEYFSDELNQDRELLHRITGKNDVRAAS